MIWEDAYDVWFGKKASYQNQHIQYEPIIEQAVERSG